MSEDQKHSSAVAKVHYHKQRSLEVALKGHECLQKLQGKKGSEVDEDVHARFGASTSTCKPSVETEKKKCSPKEKDVPPKEQLCLEKISFYVEICRRRGQLKTFEHNHSMSNFGLFFFFRPNELNFCMWSPI